jgi:hypothetical protein
MGHQYTSARARIDYNLDTVDAERCVAVPVRKLLRLFNTIGMLQQYFHRPAHYANADALHAFLDASGDDAYGAIAEAYYDLLPGLIPTDITRRLEDGDFDHPAMPLYYRERDE